MEWGGHAPYIVFEEANIDAYIKGVMASKFKNLGQACISINCIYVSEDIADEFAYKLAQKVEKLKVGNGMDEDTDVGPLINQDALNNMHNQINDAINNNRSEEHTSELQSRFDLVCRLLLEKKKE